MISAVKPMTPPGKGLRAHEIDDRGEHQQAQGEQDGGC